MADTVLFVSHKKAQCGVYEFGKAVAEVLQSSQLYHFVRIECSSVEELNKAIKDISPSAIIYNYHPSVLPWLSQKRAPRLHENKISSVSIPQIGIIHEITQEIADNATAYKNRFIPGTGSRLINSLFDYYIAPDPTLLLKNPSVFKTGRLIPEYQNNFPLSSRPVIGSFGFGTPKKGFEKIVERVQSEFDDAEIRFNIPSADFGDKNGINARAITDKCQALITKPGISLTITHDFHNKKELLNFLAKKYNQCFFYEDNGSRGLSSTIDNALAVRRPVAVSDNRMFRHILGAIPSVCIETNSLKKIIENGFTPLENYAGEWNAENLIWEYERILAAVFKKQQHKKTNQQGILQSLQSKINKIISRPGKEFTWLRNSDKANDDEMTIDRKEVYTPVLIPENISLNRILDNSARLLYKPAIDKLTKLVPKTMAKKIAEANVQQAFVFDTVTRYLPQYPLGKILCVGSYEDTASMSLIKMGLTIEEIDPMINYYLQEYITKPTTQLNSYQIIFSTSVIEHDPDDESFVGCINDLLVPGGVAIITCDYKDGWKQGDPKPGVDARFYTRADLKERLLQYMPDCVLVDEPQWECPNPDFHYLGKYVYTFATFVVKKNR